VPAGDALAVSRDDFCKEATTLISQLPNLKIIAKEANNLNELAKEFDAVCVCAGPLASKGLSEQLANITGEEYLYFYDAIAPLVERSSIDMNVCFKAERYGIPGEEGADYINCPLTKEQYYNFVEELIKAKKAPLHEGDEGVFFRGCMPIEAMAEDAPDTLLNGPMRGDGLIDPKNYTIPFSAIQLRQDDLNASVYNMVGFQTRLVYSEQERLFRRIPGLENAEFLRFGSMHRNTFLNAPKVLNHDMSVKLNEKIFVSGQISGVEGYVESIASAFYTAKGVLNKLFKRSVLEFPPVTAMGSLKRHLSDADPKNFQPMKMNFGLLPELSPLDKKLFLEKGNKRHETRLALSKRSIALLKKIFA
jgi:methylenetetrahydrofolate--tRNA-(uracil-5-)-methyltransferase